jgi:glycosyltransferase involved in cell wall biosynthesis
MDISIVTGTYNRLHSLQRMVNSARRSFIGLHGLAYQAVIVDGGSQDGTQEWCLSQPDILLIEHGKLLGAVKAFNDGALAATGNYVIMGNDDIEYVGDSVLTAYVYMQSNSDCGIGCFYQNRNGRDWHVEEMPCIDNEQQVSRPYGQVCIVPKWLGDYVGWWGDYLHTYGGDNELSSRVYELGFKVSPVPMARIADHEVDDDLRKINNITGGKDTRAVKGHHPDSWAWGRRWKHMDMSPQYVGPIIRHFPIMENPTPKKHRVVYLPIYEQGYPVQKEQKRGLREALAKVAVVAEYDYVTRHAEVGKDKVIFELRALIERLQPTILLTQLHNGAQINDVDIQGIANNWPGTKRVNWNGDFWPDNLLSEEGIKLAKAFDLQLTVNRSALDDYKKMGVNAEYWQIGYEPDGICDESNNSFDVVFLASGYSKARQELVRKLRSLNLNFGLYGNGWPKEWSSGQSMYDFKTACQSYRGAKISIGDSQWPDTGFVSNRVFQALAAGSAALAHQYFRDMDKLGLVDGETCIIWRDFAELEKKIRYYLSHEKERKAIADAGEKLALTRHSFDVRVQELLGMLDGEKDEGGWRW